MIRTLIIFPFLVLLIAFDVMSFVWVIDQTSPTSIATLIGCLGVTALVGRSVLRWWDIID